ncbi:MAG: glutamine-hydrolyzing carbamoyl-phosphate synthase small subunit [Alphaproteobacteria bacterium]|nr:glutamine-hydrolyzing carbamoyl-phosphate synthase small subunit [Alphaproteobacteria bacterium]
MPDAVYDVKTLSPFSPPSAATAVLILEDGSIFYGSGFGAEATNVGEICFNTSMTGYQEIMTDPSYAGQIITFTFPHIGNTGTNGDDIETQQPAALGMIVRNDVTEPSNWRTTSHLHQWLAAHDLPGIAGIDTRALTRTIRDNGAPKGVLCHAADGNFDIAALQKMVADWPGLKGMDLASVVSTKQDFRWAEGSFNLETNTAETRKVGLRVVAMDFGCKQNILRCLVDAGCCVDVVPATASAEDILARKPDGVFLANGPGDPAATADFAVAEIQKLIDSNMPIFGICIGHQLLAHAMGGQTRKMERGHRGANHPVRDLTTGQIEITSQNHGFCVEQDSLPADVEVTHISLFDRSIEGLRHKTKPVFCVQYHPESSPGPHDSRHLFTRFTEMMKEHQKS